MKDLQEEFTDEHQEVLKSIRMSRVILPILLGLGVVGYLMWNQYDPKEFSQINWNAHTTFWILFSVFLLVVRHLAYAFRLRILSDGEFSWLKCIELIFIWEFSSAVSPTSIGGSAVALFVLSQEKLSTAKTATIVVYSAVLDTIFFIGSLPILWLVFGNEMIRPSMDGIVSFDAWGYTFVGAYSFMATYGFIFFYGLFINPKTIKKILILLTNNRWLNKWQKPAEELGQDMITASQELKHKKWDFHFSAFLSTSTAWSCRFLLLNCLIIGLSTDMIPLNFFSQLALYARLESMFVIMAFSPTPGGAGFAELVFFGFTSDYVSQKGIALFIAGIWRLMTYYTYLLIGAIIIPNWIRKVINERKRRKQTKQLEKI